MAELISFIMVLALGFVLGSIPFGLIIAQVFCKKDPRLSGSGNMGATNVSRVCGTRYGIMTLACDVLKGFLPVFAFAGSSNGLGYLAYAAGLSVVCGHMFSMFLHFKGGKGVASTVGVFLALAPVQLILASLICIMVIWRSRYVSAGSLTLVFALPVLLLLSGRWFDMLFSLVIAGLVIYKHRDNIRRLLRGEEKPWRQTSP